MRPTKIDTSTVISIEHALNDVCRSSGIKNCELYVRCIVRDGYISKTSVARTQKLFDL